MIVQRNVDHSSLASASEGPFPSPSTEHGFARAASPGSVASECPQVGLLTAGRDKPYALGLTAALVEQGISLDYIGSDGVSGPELNSPLVNFLNFRDQQADVGLLRKISRVLDYYRKLASYAATAHPKILHILWNNKFEWFDRTFLTLFYKALGKRLVFTAHNVNAGKRDGNDSWFNRLTLRIQYRLMDHIFVHTEMMKQELLNEFGIREKKVSVIPFGINNTLPTTSLTPAEARRELKVGLADKVVLFFGNIAPYKGLEYLVGALAELAASCSDYRLIIAGRPKGAEAYWKGIQSAITDAGLNGRVIERIEYVPDEKVEVFFKAADVLVIPYTHVFQSGVLFLGYSFGLPVIASDVGSLKEGIVEERTGLVCRPCDASDLAMKINAYFSSELYAQLDQRRQDIREFANERHSWTKVGETTQRVYRELLAAK